MIITIAHAWAKRYAVVGHAKTSVQVSMSHPYSGPDWLPVEISVMYAHSLNREEALQLSQNLIIAQLVAENMERWPDAKKLGITFGGDQSNQIVMISKDDGVGTRYAG